VRYLWRLAIVGRPRGVPELLHLVSEHLGSFSEAALLLQHL